MESDLKTLKPLAEYTFGDRPMVVAHRGSSGTAPENTMASIRQGVEAGAEMVEIDVQQTADERLIVFHDHVLGRTTNGSGRVAAHEYDQISRLDAGSWMNESYRGEPVPKLIDVLEYLRGRAYLNIELKRYDGDPETGERFLISVLRSIEVADMINYTLLSSFDHLLLGQASEFNRNIPTAVIMHPDDRAMPSERAGPVGSRGVVMSKSQLSHDRIRDAREHNLPIGVYTINTREDALRAARYGACAIVTNVPGEIISVLEELVVSS